MTMPFEIPTTRRRGAVAVRANLRSTGGTGGTGAGADGGADPNAFVAELTKGFEQFKANHRRDLEEVRAGIDEQAKQIAGMRLGGGGAPADGGGFDQRTRGQVSDALRRFIGGGDEGALMALAGGDFRAAGSSGLDPAGGYSVLPVLSDQLTRRAIDASPMRRLARVVEIDSGRFEEIADVGEAGSAWVGEQEARPETDFPELRKFTVPVHEVYAAPRITQTLLDDSRLDLASWIVGKVTDAFRAKEGAAFIHGDGVSKPRGLLTYDTTDEDDEVRAWGTIQHVVTGSATGFDVADTPSTPANSIIDMVYKLRAEYRDGAAFTMNRKTAGSVRKFTDENGQYIWRQGLQLGEPETLLGYPVELDEDMDDAESGNFPIAFGNFERAYTIVDRVGLRLLRDPYTAKPHVIFYTYKRVGGGLNNSEAVKLLKVST